MPRVQDLSWSIGYQEHAPLDTGRMKMGDCVDREEQCGWWMFEKTADSMDQEPGLRIAG
jgi:hypothetical protein